MSDKLVKEIITTTTERFGDSGSIKEKITESREKIYQRGFSEKQLAEAEVVQPQESAPQEQEAPQPQPQPNEDLIKQAAATVDANKQQQGTPVAFQPTQPPQYQQYQQPAISVPQYNRVGATPAQNPQPSKFPWEK